jgi:hypothetical protein
MIKMQMVIVNQELALFQYLANTLPLSNHQPQVGNWGPTHIVRQVNSNDSISVCFFGNFFFASNDRYQPVLSVGSLQILPDTRFVSRLQFTIPSEQVNKLLSETTITHEGFRVLKLDLTVPAPRHGIGE